MKFLIIFFTIFLLNSNLAHAAMSSGSSGYDEVSLYKEGKKLVIRAKKLEKKNKKEKAKKLYLKAFSKFEKAYAKDKKFLLFQGSQFFLTYNPSNLIYLDFFYL